jgi:endo-1,4-beta-xylanase
MIKVSCWSLCLATRYFGAAFLALLITNLEARAQPSRSNPSLKRSIIRQPELPGLAVLAANHNVKFGFSLAELNPFNFDLTFERMDRIVRFDASVATATCYWHLPNWNIQGGPVIGYDDTANGPGKTRYIFEYPEEVLKFCKVRSLEAHGHVLVWAQDLYTPPWVVVAPNALGATLLVDHITTVVNRFRGKIAVWHVVNEAFQVDGQLINSYWTRSMGSQFLPTAFRTAAENDPDAKLIYNEIGMESLDSRRFDAVFATLENMVNNKVPIHGVGWQMHVSAQQVLNPNFPLASRMEKIAKLGLDNYITELDVVVVERDAFGNLPIPIMNAANLELQKMAYFKIADIFRRSSRRVSIQTWGIGDDRSWLGSQQFPLLFDINYSRKPAYFGIQNAFRNR